MNWSFRLNSIHVACWGKFWPLIVFESIQFAFGNVYPMFFWIWIQTIQFFGPNLAIGFGIEFNPCTVSGKVSFNPCTLSGTYRTVIRKPTCNVRKPKGVIPKPKRGLREPNISFGTKKFYPKPKGIIRKPKRGLQEPQHIDILFGNQNRCLGFRLKKERRSWSFRVMALRNGGKQERW